MSTTRFPAFSHLIFRMHALRQMFQRRISGDDIRELLEHGAIIEDYPDDTPYPSCLVSGMVRGRQLHGVMAYNNTGVRQLLSQHMNPTLRSGRMHFQGGDHEVRYL